MQLLLEGHRDTPTEGDHDSELLSSVLGKIARYKSRKLINVREEQEFLRILSPKNIMNNHQQQHTSSIDKENNRLALDRATRIVQNRLNKIRAEERRQKNPHDIAINENEANNAEREKQFERSSSQIPYSKVNKVNDAQSKNTEMSLSHEDIEKLFVEMCFYARLTFIQPPCCLQCAYRCARLGSSGRDRDGNFPSSIGEDIDPKSTCNNLVVWRINANTSHLLDPDKLEGNIILITCSTARALLAGETAQEMKWDRKTKTLVKIK